MALVNDKRGVLTYLTKDVERLHQSGNMHRPCRLIYDAGVSVYFLVYDENGQTRFYRVGECENNIEAQIECLRTEVERLNVLKTEGKK